MKKILLLGAFAFAVLNASAQDYSYSFQGEISDFEKIESALLALPEVEKVKVRIKEGQKVGEILFFLGRKESSPENQDGFSPVDVKRILIESGLQPNQFTELKPTR